MVIASLRRIPIYIFFFIKTFFFIIASRIPINHNKSPII
nr:MAG TPA: hypothetical protein [Caudoviricetes sp.]